MMQQGYSDFVDQKPQSQKNNLKCNRKNCRQLQDLNFSCFIQDCIFFLFEVKKKRKQIHIFYMQRFKLQINAIEPQIDDILAINSETNQLTKQSFCLRSKLKENRIIMEAKLIIETDAMYWQQEKIDKLVIHFKKTTTKIHTFQKCERKRDQQ